MKRSIAIIAVFALVAGGAFAQVEMGAFATGLQEFTNNLAPALPVNALIGSPWSDAYIGGFPHFGVGLAVGGTTVPAAFVNDVLGLLDVPSSAALDYVTKYGLPIPAAALTARLGGLILPFDIGAKIGTVPEQFKDEVAKALPAGTELNYFLAGADVRFAIWEEKKDFIDFTVGVGVDYLDGTVSLPLGLATQRIDFQDQNGDPHYLELANPKLFLSWKTLAADLNVQASKNLLIFTPYLGAGVSFGKPAVNTGLAATMQLDGADISDAQYEQLRTDLAAAGYPVPDDFNTLKNGYIFNASIDDWLKGMDYRVFGGLSVNLLIVRLDLTGSYNFIGKNLGATVGLRVQL